MVPLLAAILVLQPALDAPGPLRLATTGTGEVLVHWSLDGVAVAETADGRAASVNATAGPHTLTAETAQSGPWSALARADPRGAGISYVPAWTAHSDGAAPESMGAQAEGSLFAPVVGGLALVAAAGLAHGRWKAWRGREAEKAAAPREAEAARTPIQQEEPCICEM